MEIQIITEVLNTDRFIYDCKDNPAQRNTADHAVKALKYHLKQYSITQANVAGAIYNNQYYKIDGHTRAYLWQHELLQKPEKVHIMLYVCDTEQQLIDLYKCYDSNTAAETLKDKYSGACRLAGFEPKSSLVKKGTLPTMYRILSGSKVSTNLYEYVQIMLPALKHVDELMLTAKYTTGPFLAMILTFFCYDSRIVHEFWDAVNKERGVKDLEHGMNGVQAAVEVLNYKDRSYNIKNDFDFAIEQCTLLLGCFELYIANKRIKRRSLIKRIPSINEYVRLKYANWADLGIPAPVIKAKLLD